MQIGLSEREIILRLLAKTDALFRPVRTWTTPVPVNVFTSRREYWQSGLQFISEGIGGTARNAHQAASESLVAQGLLQRERPGHRTITARLTHHGDDVGRRMIGAWTASEVTPQLEHLVAIHDAADIDKDTPQARKGGWVCERHLAGTSEPDELYGQEADLAPLIARGWVDSTGDAAKRAYYRPTPLGRQALADGIPGDGFAHSDEYDIDGNVDFYCHEFERAMKRLLSGKPTATGEIGSLPHPVALTDDAVCIEPIWAPWNTPAPEQLAAEQTITEGIETK